MPGEPAADTRLDSRAAAVNELVEIVAEVLADHNFGNHVYCTGRGCGWRPNDLLSAYDAEQARWHQAEMVVERLGIDECASRNQSGLRVWFVRGLES